MSWAWGLTSERACFLEASDGGLSHRGGGVTLTSRSALRFKGGSVESEGRAQSLLGRRQRGLEAGPTSLGSPRGSS